MTDDHKLHAQQMATQVAIEQRNAALNESIELRVSLALAQAELAELEKKFAEVTATASSVDS